MGRDSGIDLTPLNFVNQRSGDKMERPDISGMDSEGRERLIIEAKFWAALTANQPITYLERLEENGGLLVFVCPGRRVGMISSEVQRRLQDAGYAPAKRLNGLAFDLEASRTVVIFDWDQLLAVLRDAVDREDDPTLRDELRSDVNQLIGLCSRIDAESFQPISAEDMSPSVGRRIMSYYQLIDRVMDQLKLNGVLDIDLKGLKATSQRNGYVRYFRANGRAMSLVLNFESWFTKAETPFWLTFWDGSSGGVVESVPIFPVLEETEDKVAERMASDIETLIKGFVT